MILIDPITGDFKCTFITKDGLMAVGTIPISLEQYRTKSWPQLIYRFVRPDRDAIFISTTENDDMKLIEHREYFLADDVNVVYKEV